MHNTSKNKMTYSFQKPQQDIFYSINILSPEWQIVSQLNPILYIVNFFRYAMLGQSEIEPMFGFSLIVLFTLIFFGISYYLILKGTGIKE